MIQYRVEQLDDLAIVLLSFVVVILLLGPGKTEIEAK
jgi:hypothetical protein